LWGNEWVQKALGNTAHIYDNGDYTIEAVYQDFPSNSSLQNDFYYSFDAFLNANDWMLGWDNNGMQGAFLLRNDANIVEVSKKVETLLQENLPEENKAGVFFQKFSDGYLHGEFDENAKVVGGRIEYVRIFTLAAIFLLVISCINFINLSTAYATKRSAEIGVRKVIGAKRTALIGQFITETSIITSFAFVLASALTWFLLPYVNSLTQKQLLLDLSQPAIWVSIVLVFLFTTIVSGFYPSLVISSFKPIAALKGKLIEKKNTVSLRKSLVVFQFTLAILLIVSAIVVKEQMNYINKKDLGIAKDHIISIHQGQLLTENYEVLRNDLIASKGVVDVTLVGPSPLETSSSTSNVIWPQKRQEQENIEFAILWTAHNFPDVFDIDLSIGSYYRKGSQDTLNVVINQRAAEIMNLGEDPIGKTIQYWGNKRQIMGVVKDFHNRSLYESIQPSIFLLDPNDAGTMFIKLDGDKTKEGLSSVTSVFKRILPNTPLHYEFLDEEYAANYKAETLTGKLSHYFALIAIFLSCLGLFGLATFIAKQRTKEIGIRKVLGASIKNITFLISKDFLALIGIAVLIASPLAYYFMSLWLDDFAYHIDIPLWVFIVASSLTIIVALTTIAFQAIKSALADPVKSLRTE